MKKIILVTCLVCLSISICQAQETEDTKSKNKKQEKLHIRLKDSLKPDVYIDGKKYDYAVIEWLDQDKIESISVIKDELAIKEYNAPNGVLLIETKKKTESDNSKIRIRGTENVNDPVIIIDGKVSSKSGMDKISPDDIELISVIKGEEAIEKYNAPNGVILITLKKRKNKTE